MRIRSLLLASLLLPVGCRSTEDPDPVEDNVASTAADTPQQADENRRDDARLAAEDMLREGDAYLSEASYRRAAESYRRAQNVVNLYPGLATGNLDPGVISAKLANARALAQEESAIEDDRLQREAEEARRQREEQQTKYREDRLRTLYAKANSAFQREQYSVAETLAEQILLHDPGNETATELRDIAAAARHQKRRAESRRAYRESWVKTFQELDTLAVAQTDVLVFDDLERWREVSRRRPRFATRSKARAIAI